LNRTLLALCALALASCHMARIEPPQPTCYDDAVVSCEACTDRGCSWCREGPNDADGYCCKTGARCAEPIRAAKLCPAILDCDQATITSCGECLERHCAWCPSEGRCRARGSDGTFPRCEARISGTLECPAAASPGGP
jgi:hypothetical protein